MVFPQATALCEYAIYMCVCVCVVLTYIRLIGGEKRKKRPTSVSQVITLRLAIHSGIALSGPGAELFIAASLVLTHTLTDTQN